MVCQDTIAPVCAGAAPRVVSTLDQLPRQGKSRSGPSYTPAGRRGLAPVNRG